jgi:uncharacterized protein
MSTPFDGLGTALATRPKQRRGFAAMSPEQRQRIASMGGIAAHKSGNAYEWTPDQASEAGRKGGGKRKRA